MQEAGSGFFQNQRRRSERVSQPLPIIVRGVDLLGQPFEERTSALAYNVHGCRYFSKHHLSHNAWVTLEIPDDDQAAIMRARVAWSQRPQSVRDFFQVGVEFEYPANIWGLESSPDDWRLETTSHPGAYQGYTEQQYSDSTEALGPAFGISEEPVPETPFDSTFNAVVAARSDQEPEPVTDFSLQQDSSSPERNIREELRRQAQEALQEAADRVTDRIRASVEELHQQRLATAEEFFRTWKDEFARTQRIEPQAETDALTETQENFLNQLKVQFEERFGEARQLLDEIGQKADTIRSDAEVVREEAARAEQARARAEELASSLQANAAVQLPASPAIAAWNERVESELALAQSQWNELLQASLDRGIQRLASQLSTHSKDVLRSAEQKLAERFEELRQPLAETANEAREILRDMRAELDEEMSRARGSLVDIEHVAGRIKDYSTQLEASSHDTLNELHRRLENILEVQTDQLNRHADQLVNGLSARLTPTLEGLERQLVERVISDVETRLSPKLEQVPELLRELSAREIEGEETLRLHRERLRQATEHQLRELSAQAAATLPKFREDVEAIGREVLSKWTAEMNASGARASQASSEAIGQTSEWLQEEATARLQVLVEQSLGTANSNFGELAAQSAVKHGEDLTRQAADHFAKAQAQVDSVLSDAVSRSHSSFDEASQAAAASFGQVLRGISDQEMQNFTSATRNSLQERMQELEASGQEVIGNLSAATEFSLENFRARIASEMENSVTQGRETLAAEMASLREQFSSERDTRQREWAEGLDQLSIAATAKHEDRLQTACDAWIVSSVRRLNEHGQSTIESLTRLTDQALRDSCSKVFENLAEMMRNRNANAASVGVFVPMAGREPAENSTAQ